MADDFTFGEGHGCEYLEASCEELLKFKEFVGEG